MSKTVSFSEDNPDVFEYEQTQIPEVEVQKKEQSQERKDWFMKFMAISMGIQERQQRLEEVSFEGVAKYIADGKCHNILTMVGAGVSTSAGIPDYRTPGTGMFDQMKAKYPNLKMVEDIFNIQFFLRDPKPFFERSRRFFEISLKPTPCHYFIRLLHEKGLLLRHYTQNIDTLERLAGLPADKVVEAHGSFYTSHCMHCDAEYSFFWMEKRVLEDEVVLCEEEGCTGVVKPDIVMYGESLDTSFGEMAEEDTLKCDLLIVLGTALAVQPFASLTSKVKTCTPRIYINLDRGKTAKRHPISDIMFGGGFDFDCDDNVRDVFKQAKCDDACYELADILDWGEELRTLVETEHRRIEAEEKARGKKPVATTAIEPAAPDTTHKPETTATKTKTTPQKPTTAPATANKHSNPANKPTNSGAAAENAKSKMATGTRSGHSAVQQAKGGHSDAHSKVNRSGSTPAGSKQTAGGGGSVGTARGSNGPKVGAGGIQTTPRTTPGAKNSSSTSSTKGAQSAGGGGAGKAKPTGRK